MKNKKLYLGVLMGALASGTLVNQASAVPSFARQTGMACAACHSVFPELNSFGRTFKLNGYTLTGIKQVESKNSSAASGLKFNEIPPLSAMLQVAGTFTKSQTPADQISLPDQLSFFFAGEISPHMGSFIQLTMPQSGNFEMDNMDIRYANHAGPVTYGVTLNNSPTTQDIWNSTPSWGFPFTHGASVTSPLVADGLGQNVAGLGGYADWGNGIYTELSFYRDTNTFDSPGGAKDTRINGVAPYLRLAWSNNFANSDYLMVGAYAMQTNLVNGTTYSGAKDEYKDATVDLQYEHQLRDSNMVSVHASYTNEDQKLALSGGGSPRLNNTRLDAIYHWGYHATATVGYTTSKGKGGSYDDTAYTVQYSYLPWQNTKFSAQYVAYTKKGGSTSSVSDNNTLLLQGWLMW